MQVTMSLLTADARFAHNRVKLVNASALPLGAEAKAGQSASRLLSFASLALIEVA
jgi:hypothetical protein